MRIYELFLPKGTHNYEGVAGAVAVLGAAYDSYGI